jgi:hypothetical protein
MGRIYTLKDAVSVIRMQGREVVMDITSEDMARKMDMPWDQFEAHLNAPGRTPDEVLGRLWTSYMDLVEAIIRLNRSSVLRGRIDTVKRLGMEKGMTITDDEIVEKLGITRQQLADYLYGEIDTPDDVLSRFPSAWPDLLRNTRFINVIETVELYEEEEDEAEEKG